MGACVFLTLVSKCSILDTTSIWTLGRLSHSAVIRKLCVCFFYRSSLTKHSSFPGYCGSAWGKRICNSPTAICPCSMFLLFLLMLAYRSYLAWEEDGTVQGAHSAHDRHTVSTRQSGESRQQSPKCLGGQNGFSVRHADWDSKITRTLRPPGYITDSGIAWAIMRPLFKEIFHGPMRWLSS